MVPKSEELPKVKDGNFTLIYGNGNGSCIHLI